MENSAAMTDEYNRQREKMKFMQEVGAIAFHSQMNMLSGMYGGGKLPKSYSTLAPPSPTYPSECPSCYSHEFRMHHGRWVCSFCRSST